MKLDRSQIITRWSDENNTEMVQLDKYYTFKDLDKDSLSPVVYKNIRVHLVYDVNHHRCQNPSLVDDVHQTDIPVENVYSWVVYLCDILLLVFLDDLDKIETCATDFGNVYLESMTLENFYIILGTEFGDRKGYIIIVAKALYGLQSSAL